MARPQNWTNDKEHFYKYLSPDTAKIVLENNTLRWSLPTLFNDPFDIQFDLHVDYDRDTITTKILDEMWLTYTGKKPMAPNSPLAHGWNLLQGLNFSKEQLIHEFKDAVEEGVERGTRQLPHAQAESRKIITSTQVLCLSEVFDNILMWSHYAKNHTGAVLRFSCIDYLDSAWGVAQPVKYEAAMPTLWNENEFIEFMSGQRVLNVREVLDKALLSKAVEWSYEKEWRLAGALFSQRPFEDIPFHIKELTGIFLGCRVSPGDKDEILKLAAAKYSHAAVFTGRKSERKFALEFEPL